MKDLVRLLAENPLVLLLSVAALGFAAGKVTRLGIAAVLFTGLAVGALDPTLRLPELAWQSGLALFVYVLGLAFGPGFFASFRRRGLRDCLLVLGVLLVSAAVAGALSRLLGLGGTLAAGAFAGGLTNTPALAGVLEAIQHSSLPPGEKDRLLQEPVVAYSLAYPFGVAGMLLAILLAKRAFGIDPEKDAARLREIGAVSGQVEACTVRVLRVGVLGRTLGELAREHGWHVIFARHRRRDGTLTLAGEESSLAAGDLLTAAGSTEDLRKVAEVLGEVSPDAMDLDRAEIDYRRVFVSSREAAGYRIRDLRLGERFGAMITRVRRGDAEFVPDGDTVLEPGDRVRVLSRRERLPEAARFLGDSYRAVSEVDLLSFCVGLILGIAAGMVPVELPGGITFRLGLAGGPLVVALVLGSLGRTGPVVWTLPYGANLTLRQLGLVVFLAGVGTRAGGAFAATLGEGGAWALLGLGAAVTCASALSLFLAGHFLLRIPMSLLVGMAGGVQTQPALLAFAVDRSRSELPNLGYASVYPAAFVLKILLAQLLLSAA